MTRDMLWTPSRARPRRKKRGRRLAFVLALVGAGANMGIASYRSGPPSQPLSATSLALRPVSGSAAATETSAATETATETETETSAATATATAQAVVELDGPPFAPAVGARFDAFAGLRAPAAVQRVEQIELRARQMPAGLLAEAGVASQTVNEVIAALAAHVDFRRMRPGDRFTLQFDANDELHAVDVQRGMLDRAHASREGVDGWQAVKLEVPVETVLAHVTGSVDSSLWDAMVSAGEDPRLVYQVVDIFAWEIDFYSEVYSGDTFRVLVEKRYVDGNFLEYGDVRAAEFVSAGAVHRGFLYRGSDGSEGYYDEGGGSMRRQLLKSPLQYGRVTSRYGNRRHPVLGYTRRHNGVDYGVPTGTPTWSVGDGRVVKAGWHGGFGRLVEVRHANGWLSQYGHLSRIDVRPGQRVTQKQVVGRVGASGLATGPHLHYGLQHNGSYVNPLRQAFDRGKALSGAELERFRRRVVDHLAAELDSDRVAREPGAELAKQGSRES